MNIEGKKIDCLIDTGASTSIIHDQLFLDRPRIRLTNPIQLRTLNGRNIITHQICTDIPQEFNHEADMAWKLLNLSNRRFQAILGQNTLRAVGAVINMGDETIEVYGKKTKFKDACPYEEIHHLEAIKSPDILNKLDTSHMNKEEENEFRKLSKANKDLFFQEGQQLTNVKEIKHPIITSNKQPIYSKTYRFPKVHEHEVEKQVKEMLKQGIIKPSKSPYNSPVWIVPKKMDNSGEKKWRIVIDYRKLNEVSIDDKFPIPNIDGIFDKLGRAQYFTTLDLAKGFHQILVDERDREKTAFSTPNGHYEYVRMPFGLKNAPATFQRMMNFVLQEHINKICVVYLDDILIFSTSIQEHVDAINKIFKVLREHNLKIQIDKCKFFAKETEYLGHILTEKGIKPNDKKIESIKQLKIPNTKKQIKSFLGITGYYRKFIKDYAKIAQPLTQCLKKDNNISKDSKYINAFEKLKELIVNHPILQYPDFNKQFVLTTDASQFAIGAVLSQNDHPICYASRTLNEHEKNYSTIEKELLAIVWSTKYFRPYLYGIKFLIKTDHRPLIWLSGLKEPNSKLQRWKIKLNEYNYDIEFVKGKENQVADFLSRINVDEKEIYHNDHSELATIHSGIEEVQDHIPITEGIVNKYKTQILLVKEKNKDMEIVSKNQKIYISQQELQNVSGVIDTLRRFIKDKGTIGIYSELDYPEFNILQQEIIKLFSNNENLKFRKCKFLAAEMKNEEETFERIENYHSKTNHRGINENYEEMKKEVYYPKLKILIQRYINNCEVCNLAKYDRNPPKFQFKISETPTDQNEIVHADIFHCQKRYFLTILDKFSKHLYQTEILDKNSLTTIQAVQNRISLFGKPKLMVFDNEFNNVNVKEFLNKEGISYHFTSAKNHTGNADIERVHNTILEHIKILTQKDSKMNIIEKMNKATEFYNNTIHSSTKEKPINILYNKGKSKEEIYSHNKQLKENVINKLNSKRKDILPNEYPYPSGYIKNYQAERRKELPNYYKAKIYNKNKEIFNKHNNNKIHPNRIKRHYKYFTGPSNVDNSNNVVNNNNSSTSSRCNPDRENRNPSRIHPNSKRKC